MKRIKISLGAVLLLAACNVSIGGGAPIDEARIDATENSIRQLLAPQGTVLNVEMRRVDDDHMAGFADMRDVNGVQGRFTCTADRDRAKREFAIRCTPPAAAAASAQPAPPAPDQAAQPPADEGAQPPAQEEAPAEEGGEQSR